MSERKSVFELGHISPDTKFVEKETAKHAFLLVAEDAAGTLQDMGFSSAESSDIAQNGFWHLDIHQITESHTDSFSLNNTLSDTVFIFATGAIPVGISFVGMVKTNPYEDDRINFLKLYSEKIRGRMLEESRMVLYFGYKDTVMRLYIMDMTVVVSTAMEDFTQISINAIASHYQNTMAIDKQGSEASSEGTTAPNGASEVIPSLPSQFSDVAAAIPSPAMLTDVASNASTYLSGAMGSASALSELASSIPSVSSLASSVPGISNYSSVMSSLTGAASSVPDLNVAGIPGGGGLFSSGMGIDTLGLPTETSFLSSALDGASSAFSGLQDMASGAMDMASSAYEYVAPAVNLASETMSAANTALGTVNSLTSIIPGTSKIKMPKLF